MADPTPRFRRTAGLAAALALALVACGSGSSEEAAPVAVQAAPASAETSSGPYAVYGLPGPWSREGASRHDFERESHVCRARSRDARNAPGIADRSDAAYRAFLECMAERDWTRGALPPRPEQVSRAASGAAALP